VKIPHVKGSHPLIFEGTEPTLDFFFLCGSIRPAVVDSGTDTGSEQFHLSVLVGRTVIEVKNLWLSILGNCGLYNGHQVDKGVIKEYVSTKDKMTGIIDQGDHIDAMLFTVSRF